MNSESIIKKQKMIVEYVHIEKKLGLMFLDMKAALINKRRELTKEVFKT